MVFYQPPWYAKVLSWNEIEEKYLNLGKEFFPFYELVKHIQQSDASKRLFAYTYMHKLVISIYEEIDPLLETLHIEYDWQNEKWFFSYYANPFKDPEFERTYPKEKGIEKFDSFLKKIRW
ncbi:MAG: hypothetical protein H7Y04_02395 [Verrucomicrobia bacterium]|nr:hypothetical protein [Cytophagales bacterium]